MTEYRVVQAIMSESGLRYAVYQTSFPAREIARFYREDEAQEYVDWLKFFGLPNKREA